MDGGCVVLSGALRAGPVGGAAAGGIGRDHHLTARQGEGEAAAIAHHLDLPPQRLTCVRAVLALGGGARQIYIKNRKGFIKVGRGTCA